MIVGLTGGIGSGKTTTAQIFSHLGVAVFEADKVSKTIIDEDEKLQRELKALLGDSIIQENGKIDRPEMARIIFNDDDLLAQTNALIHPAVARNFQTWYQDQNSPYVIREAAILFESGSYKDCDKIVVVTADEELRIERVMKRSGVNRSEVLARIKKQWPESEKLDRADYVVQNNGNQSLIKQVLHIHEDLIRIANQGSR